MNQSPIQGSMPDPLRAVTGANTKPGKEVQSAQSADPSNPTFHALLERLSQRATELEKTSQKLDAPELLADAVDSARLSLEEAQTLSDRLLEAFRATQQRHLQPDAVGNQEEGSR